jgi:hypothetical protein
MRYECGEEHSIIDEMVKGHKNNKGGERLTLHLGTLRAAIPSKHTCRPLLTPCLGREGLE